MQVQNSEQTISDNEIAPPVLDEKQLDLKNNILKELKLDIPINKRQQLPKLKVTKPNQKP